MKKPVALLIPVWAAAFASAAFAYAVHRPIALPDSQEGRGGARASSATYEPVATETTLERTDEGIHFVAPVVITARAPRARVPPPVYEVRCGEWRMLVQGSASQRVRDCD
jgi:hypothetical protein